MNYLYHNPRCRKSREALAILEDKGVDFEIVEYLNTPPSLEELQSIQKKLELHPLEFMRTGEAVFKELGLSKKDEKTVDEWLKIMIEHPILIERPIFITEDKAVVGRPPERVLELL